VERKAARCDKESKRQGDPARISGGGFTDCWPGCAEVESILIACQGHFKVVVDYWGSTASYVSGGKRRCRIGLPRAAFFLRQLMKPPMSAISWLVRLTVRRPLFLKVTFAEDEGQPITTSRSYVLAIRCPEDPASGPAQGIHQVVQPEASAPLAPMRTCSSMPRLPIRVLIVPMVE
jgi:hypothetical protein